MLIRTTSCPILSKDNHANNKEDKEESTKIQSTSIEKRKNKDVNAQTSERK